MGDVSPGTPIVAVQINRHDVFDLDDPSTSAWPYRWVNALHILTREDFIRRLLLFKVGDVLDPARLEETEIILRGDRIPEPGEHLGAAGPRRGRSDRRDARPVDAWP